MVFKGRKRRIAVIAALCCAVVAGAVLWNFPGKSKPLPAPRVFYRDVMLPTTPMKNQGSSYPRKDGLAQNGEDGPTAAFQLAPHGGKGCNAGHV